VQLITAANAEARRLGISASDEEVMQRILAIPAFQENGHFIGEARYRQMLQFNNPPLTTLEFEDNLRRGVLVEKLRTAVTGWMSVSDTEAGQEYRRLIREWREFLPTGSSALMLV